MYVIRSQPVNKTRLVLHEFHETEVGKLHVCLRCCYLTRLITYVIRSQPDQLTRLVLHKFKKTEVGKLRICLRCCYLTRLIRMLYAHNLIN